MLLDEGELVRIEEKLRGTDICAARPFVSRIQYAENRPVIIVCSKFAAVNFAALVIERRKNERLAELAFIEGRVRAFVETVESDVESFHDFLRDARRRNNARAPMLRGNLW